MLRKIGRALGRLALASAQALIIGALIAAPIWASQSNLYNPTSGTLSGLSMVQNQNAANDALATCNAAGSPPTTQFLSLSPSNSDCWDDTSTANWIKHKIYMGGNWVVAAYFDLTNSLYTGIVGGGAINNVASASSTDLCGGTQFAAYLNVTGTTTITSFGSTCAPGIWKRVQFSGVLTLTYNGTSLILPTAANITTAAGDTADAVALGSGNWIVTHYQRATGAALSSVGLNAGASALAQSALGYEAPINLQLAAAVSGDQLTVSVLGVNGSNPSSSNPVLVNFRSQTLNNGSTGVVYGQITGALSMTLGATDSQGCTTAVACRLWATLICQTESSGACTSVLLGLSLQSTSAQIYPLQEDALQSTGAGTAGGTTAGVIQTSVASLSGKAIRIAGYVEVTWTSGTGWATTPSKVQLFGPGVHKPGDVVQVVSGSTSSSTPSCGSNTQTGLTASITPTSAVNLIRANADWSLNSGTTNSISASLRMSRGSGPTYFGTQQPLSFSLSGSITNNVNAGGHLTGLDAPATTSSTAYYVYCNGGGTFNGVGEPLYITLEELMSALTPPQQPANDNATLRLVG